MNSPFITLTLENLEQEHVCCAISDKKHQYGVNVKKQWLRERIPEGHIFRKLNVNGKVFIEYAPLETAWVPVCGENYLYIYCLWVAGSYKGQGYAKALLEDCLRDAKAQGKSGVCVLSSKKKKPFLTDKKYMLKYGFEVVDSVGDGYELLAYSLDGTLPHFAESVKQPDILEKGVTIYYGFQCPFIPNCISQIKTYCEEHQIPHHLIPVDSLEKAKNVPCIFNNWAVFYNGTFATVQLLNENSFKKMFRL